MIIDFHTHVFPDKIAKSTVDALKEKSNGTAYTDATLLGLVSSMETAGINISITSPVLTKSTQFDRVTQNVLEINNKLDYDGKKIISFAGMHPDCEDIEGKIKHLAELGFMGIKIHPDYQQTNFNDEKYIKIIKCAKEHDLIVLTHAGVDNGYKDYPIRCTPDMVLDVYSKVPYNKLVLAHYGAHKMWEEVYDKLCGLDLYFDTAFSLHQIDEKLFKKILEKHGADKILFATDSPWSDQKEYVKIIKSFNLGKETEDKVFYKNALKLLNLTEKNI